MESTQITTDMQNKFSVSALAATSLTATYDTLYSNYQNIADLYENYLRENDVLNLNITTLNADMITNDRKTYYETQGYTNLTEWYRFFMWIYYILVFVFLLGIFLSNSSMTFMKKILLLACLIIYPFVVLHIALFLVGIGGRIYSLFPKNAYITI